MASPEFRAWRELFLLREAESPLNPGPKRRGIAPEHPETFDPAGTRSALGPVCLDCGMAACRGVAGPIPRPMPRTG